MDYSKKLLPPLVSAAIMMIAVTNYCIFRLVGSSTAGPGVLASTIWPVALPASVAVILVMSTLYRSLLELLVQLERTQKACLDHAQKDALTGLSNRRQMQERLEQAVSRFHRTGERFAVVMLDLDHFKRVNDVLGHQVGDEVLREAASRLKLLLREMDTVARFGGDEFFVLQTGITREEDVQRLCARVCERLQLPYEIAGRSLALPASLGAVIASQEFNYADDYVRTADIALYEAKSSGRNCYRLFSSEMDARIKRRDHIEGELRIALQSRKGLELHYQPQIDGKGTLIGVEGLLRWTHIDLGEVSPKEIVSVAEEAGLIHALGEYTFRFAAGFARKNPSLTVAINMSPKQFSKFDNLADRMLQLASQERVSPTQMEIEITEQVFINSDPRCEEQIRRLGDHGFRLVLDDFGTGYSSLSCLKRFQVQKLKLDSSLTSCDSDEGGFALARAAVSLGHLLGLEVVAEGIETEIQEALALEAGCDALQGHRYAKAMTERAFADFAAGGLRSAA